MTKLALMFTVMVITFAVIHSGVSQKEVQHEHDQAESPLEEELEDGSDRVGQSFASANANAAAGFGPRPRPGPQSRPPPSPQRSDCLACVGCPSAQNATVKQCGYSFDPSKQKKCVLYAEKYHHMTEPWVIRGCASERGSCADIRASHDNHGDLVKLLYCKECEGNVCNDSNGAGTHSLPDLFMAFVAMVVTPMITKYTMS